MAPVVLMDCPCTPGRLYASCCGLVHERFADDGHLTADTAETLMRSRYSAFVLGLSDYLLATWHPRTRPASLSPQEAGLRWLGLDVKHSALQDERHATVSFVARSKLGGRAHRLAETSRFERIDGIWYYLDGSFA
jgi:SEC-C motif domain protein